MNRRFCVMCGIEISAMRIDAEFCGSVCRNRATRIRKRLKRASLDLIDALDLSMSISHDVEQEILFSRIKARLNM